MHPTFLHLQPVLNEEEPKSKMTNGGVYKNGSAKSNGHAHGTEILANGNLRNGKGDHVEKKRL